MLVFFGLVSSALLVAVFIVYDVREFEDETEARQSVTPYAPAALAPQVEGTPFSLPSPQPIDTEPAAGSIESHRAPTPAATTFDPTPEPAEVPEEGRSITEELAYTQLLTNEVVLEVFSLPETRSFQRGDRFADLHPWQPEAVLISGAVACTEEGRRLAWEGSITQQSVGGRLFCHEYFTEGAAGSRYSTHAYSTDHEGNTILTTFTTRSVNCGTLEHPEVNDCLKETSEAPERILRDILAFTPLPPPQPDPEPPVLTSITPRSGDEGTVLTLSGTSLAGFEGDLDAWIERNDGQRMYLPAFGTSTYPDDTQVTVRIPAWACTYNYRYEGSCSSYARVTPGTYSVFVAPWGVESNTLSFEVEGPDCEALDEDACIASPVCTGIYRGGDCDAEGNCEDVEIFDVCYPKPISQREAEGIE